jgi:hypothetical protein
MSNASPTTVARFSMGSLLMLLTYAVGLLAVAWVNLPVGIVLALATVPAMIRTNLYVQQQRRHGRAVDRVEQATLLLSSLVVVFVIGFVSGTSFFTASFVSAAAGMAVLELQGNRDFIFPTMVGLLVGLVAGGAALLAVGRAIWPYKGWDQTMMRYPSEDMQCLRDEIEAMPNEEQSEPGGSTK